MAKNNINKNGIFMPPDHMEELYNSSNPLVRLVHQQRLNSIIKFLPDKEGLKILDGGCGEGHLIKRMYEKNNSHFYYGIDITETALEQAKKRCPFGIFHLMDLRKIDLQDEFFDVVIATEALEHIVDYRLAINEMKRVLKTGGVFILTFPNEFTWTISRFLLRRDPIKVPDHVNSFNPTKIKKCIGLKFLEQKNLPFPFPFVFSLGSLVKLQK